MKGQVRPHGAGEGTTAGGDRPPWTRSKAEGQQLGSAGLGGGPVLPSPPPAGRDSKKLSLGLSPPCRHLVQLLAGPPFVLGTRGE